MKIKEIKIYEKVLKDGTKSAGITFDDGVFGFYNFRGDISLKVGDDVNYSYEVKEKKDGSGEYKVLDISRPTPAPQPAKIVAPSTERLVESKSFTEMKFEARMNVIKLAVSAYVAGKIEYDQVRDHFVAWYGMADASIDELRNE